MIVQFLAIYGYQKLLNIQYCFFFFGAVLLNLLKVWMQIRFSIKSFNILQKNEKKKREQDAIVSQLLPKTVKKFINNNLLKILKGF